MYLFGPLHVLFAKFGSLRADYHGTLDPTVNLKKAKGSLPLFLPSPLARGDLSKGFALSLERWRASSPGQERPRKCGSSPCSCASVLNGILR